MVLPELVPSMTMPPSPLRWMVLPLRVPVTCSSGANSAAGRRATES